MPMEAKSIIEIKKIKKSYQGKAVKVVLRDVSFLIQKGSIHGLIGENGAGKTTIIKTLMGGIKPNRGKIYLMGKEIEADEQVNQKIGFMTEKVEFAEDLTVEDFIHLAGQVRNIPFQEVENRLRQSDLHKHR
jgi:ABC-2 type transport system ATP-binding protein